MNGLTVSGESHKRILKLIAAENWKAFSSADEDLLQSMILTGHIAFTAKRMPQPQVRLRITWDGLAYLIYLSR